VAAPPSPAPPRGGRAGALFGLGLAKVPGAAGTYPRPHRAPCVSLAEKLNP
jgi:hypothetical protein